jgi:hypothetical protein
MDPQWAATSCPRGVKFTGFTNGYITGSSGFIMAKAKSFIENQKKRKREQPDLQTYLEYVGFETEVSSTIKAIARLESIATDYYRLIAELGCKNTEDAVQAIATLRGNIRAYRTLAETYAARSEG